MPGWNGERLDVGWAIAVLHPLAQRPSVTAFESGSRPIGEETSYTAATIIGAREGGFP
jgi:hypothetical protein